MDWSAWFKAESEAGAWGLAQAIIEACNTLSEALSPRLQKQIHALMEQGAMDLAIGAKQTWVMMDLLTKKGESKVVGSTSLIGPTVLALI